MESHKAVAKNTIFLLDEPSMKEVGDLSEDKWSLSASDLQSFTHEDLKSMQAKYPFLSFCKILLLEQ